MSMLINGGGIATNFWTFLIVRCRVTSTSRLVGFSDSESAIGGTRAVGQYTLLPTVSHLGYSRGPTSKHAQAEHQILAVA